MQATRTIDRATLDQLRTLKSGLDNKLEELRDHLESNELSEELEFEATDRLIKILTVAYTFFDPLILGIDELVTENERLKSMANHPAGKGRCRCPRNLAAIPEGARGL